MDVGLRLLFLFGAPALLCAICTLIACLFAWRNADRSRPLFQFSLMELITFVLLLTPGLVLIGQTGRPEHNYVKFPMIGMLTVFLMGSGAFIGWLRSRTRLRDSDPPWKPLFFMAAWSLGFTGGTSLITLLWLFLYYVIVF